MVKRVIRAEQPDDSAAIAGVTAAAFADVKYSSQTEPAIVAALRTSGVLTLSLVAVERDAIIGHIAFSPVTIDGRAVDWFGLGPVSVSPDRQRQDIGSALIRDGLNQLRHRAAAGCVLLGDPAYYGRFGFEHDDRLRYDGAPAEYFLCQKFAGEMPSGRVDYPVAFSAR